MTTNVEKFLADFQIFKDPATEFLVLKNKNQTRVEITRAGSKRIYVFDDGSDEIICLDAGRDKLFSSFRSLLSSDEFADLRSLKGTQKRLFSDRRKEYMNPEGFVFRDGNSAEPLSYNLVQEISAPSSVEQLICLLVDGPAGVGKTSLIERLVNDRAASDSDIAILHVTSRGRRLANLRDAFAGTITDLRAKFFPDEIAVLVRYRLLQVALDGFDEFVDPSGYKDAWAALKDFMRECGSSGPLILSGRDTFFDQQKFAEQLSGVGGGALVVTARLSEVQPDTAKKWLSENGWTDEQINSDETNKYFRRGSYILRPFFISNIARLKGWSDLNGRSPQSFLIDSMVEREANILHAALSKSLSDVKNSLFMLFETIAEDMIERESDSIPAHYLAFVAEYSFSNILDSEAVSRLNHSLGSLALLERAETGNELRFPHSEIQNRFFSRAIIRHFREDHFIAFIGRIIFGMDRIEAFSDEILTLSKSHARLVINKIEIMQSSIEAGAYFSQNMAALRISCLSRVDAFDNIQSIANVYASDVKLVELVQPTVMESVVISRLDIRNCDLTNVNFLNSEIETVFVDEATRFGASTPAVKLIQYENYPDQVAIRSPVEIDKWIETHSTKNIDGDIAPSRLLKHFDRLMRRFIAQSYIRDVDSDEGSFLIRGEYWEIIKKILQDSCVLEVNYKSTSGQKAPFYGVDNALALLNPGLGTYEYDIRRKVSIAGVTHEL